MIQILVNGDFITRVNRGDDSALDDRIREVMSLIDEQPGVMSLGIRMEDPVPMAEIIQFRLSYPGATVVTGL